MAAGRDGQESKVLSIPENGNLSAKLSSSPELLPCMEEFKVTNKTTTMDAYDRNDRTQPSVLLYMEANSHRLDGRLRKTLSLKQLDVYSNLVDIPSVIVLRMTIQAAPKGLSDPDAEPVRMKMTPDPSKETILSHKSATCGITLHKGPKKSSIQFHRAKMTSRGGPTGHWLPAKRSKNSAIWTWRRKRWTDDDGRSLKLGQCKWGNLRQISELNSRMGSLHMPPGSFDASASWDVPNELFLNTEWLITVKIETAHLKKIFCGLCCRLANGPSITIEHHQD